MTWLLALMSLLALLAGALAMPLDLRFAAALDALDAPVRRNLRLRWAFGIVDVVVRKGKGDRPRKSRQPSPPRRRRPSRFRPRKLIMNPAFWTRMMHLLLRLRGALHWRRLHIRARFGLDDPADTGRLWGTIGPLAAIAIPSHTDVELLPAFEGEALTFHSEGELRLVPLQLLWILLSFFAAPATWRVVWPAWERR